MTQHEVEYFVKFKCNCGFVMYEDANRSAKLHTCPKCKKQMTRHVCAQRKETKCQTYWW